MGKALLILVGAFVITGGSLIYGTVNDNSVKNTERIGSYASKLTAREIAQTGMQEAVLKLSQAYKNGGSYTGPTTWKGSYHGGSYTNTLNSSGSNHSITTTSIIEGEQYVIQREYNIDPLAAVPEGMRRALTSEKTMTFNQTAVVEHIARYTTNENSDILSNESIIIDGGFVCVFGFGLREGTTEVNNWQTEAGIFLPPDNPDSAPVTQSVSGIELPEVVVSNYSNVATVTKPGDTAIDGHYTLGTEDNPVIWYVDGDLTTTGEVTFSGYGIIAVDGDIQIDHKVYSTGGNDITEGNLAFYANDGITVNRSIEAHLYANGPISASTDGGSDSWGIEVTGGMTTRDAFDFSSGKYVGVKHRQPSAAIVSPIFGTNETVELVSTREWAVVETGTGGSGNGSGVIDEELTED